MNLPAQVTAIGPMTIEAIDRVRRFENLNLQREQVAIDTQHLIHAGLYARTIVIPANVVLTGALIKRATTLILQGDATVSLGDHSTRLVGYHVIAASANRKQAFVAHEDTYLTMIFPTQARTVAEAEDEFTDEAQHLMSRHSGMNTEFVTGE